MNQAFPLGGGFIHVVFLMFTAGEMIQFEQIFSDGLVHPPTLGETFGFARWYRRASDTTATRPHPKEVAEISSCL